jgi:hypothetical protein
MRQLYTIFALLTRRHRRQISTFVWARHLFLRSISFELMLSRAARHRMPTVKTICIRVGSHVETFRLSLESLINRRDSIGRVSALHGIAHELVEASRSPAPPPSRLPEAPESRTLPFRDSARHFQPLEQPLPVHPLNDGFASEPFEFTGWLGDTNADSWTQSALWIPDND